MGAKSGAVSTSKPLELLRGALVAAEGSLIQQTAIFGFVGEPHASQGLDVNSE